VGLVGRFHLPAAVGAQLGNIDERAGSARQEEFVLPVPHTGQIKGSGEQIGYPDIRRRFHIGLADLQVLRRGGTVIAITISASGQQDRAGDQQWRAEVACN
jgi:hypothetical protein